MVSHERQKSELGKHEFFLKKLLLFMSKLQTFAGNNLNILEKFAVGLFTCSTT